MQHFRKIYTTEKTIFHSIFCACSLVILIFNDSTNTTYYTVYLRPKHNMKLNIFSTGYCVCPYMVCLFHGVFVRTLSSLSSTENIYKSVLITWRWLLPSASGNTVLIVLLLLLFFKSFRVFSAPVFFSMFPFSLFNAPVFYVLLTETGINDNRVKCYLFICVYPSLSIYIELFVCNSLLVYFCWIL